MKASSLVLYAVYFVKFLCRHVTTNVRQKVKSAYEPKWPIRPELIPVSVALSD